MADESHDQKSSPTESNVESTGAPNVTGISSIAFPRNENGSKQDEGYARHTRLLTSDEQWKEHKILCEAFWSKRADHISLNSHRRDNCPDDFPCLVVSICPYPYHKVFHTFVYQDELKEFNEKYFTAAFEKHMLL